MSRIWAGVLHFKAEKWLLPPFLLCLVLKGLSSKPGYLYFTSPAFYSFSFSETEDRTNSTHIKSYISQFPGDAAGLGF